MVNFPWKQMVPTSQPRKDQKRLAPPPPRNEVDGHALAAEATRAADAVDVELPVVGQVVANDQGHLEKVKVTKVTKWLDLWK